MILYDGIWYWVFWTASAKLVGEDFGFDIFIPIA
jgi:hypothetical protein